ncbi:hypothetical protein ACFYWS_20725 [Streptomyces sp. NPDC002795]|uniref:hypothetical protein n=1 Tax=Streptomyces sp. NPDC002795 TaxID=3364665 RepID=UPI0036B83515
MQQPATILDNLFAQLTAYGLSDQEIRATDNLISDVLHDAHEASNTDHDFTTWQELLPAALGQVLVDLLAPVADHPHRAADMDFSANVLVALLKRLS